MMINVEEHLKQCGFDESLLNDFIELYQASSLVDPNRVQSGVDLFRNYEYGIPLQWVKDKINSDTKVLDIGSSSTIWPAMIFNKFNCQIHATDIDMTHLETQKHYLYNIGKLDELGKKFIFEHQDATAMSYEDNSFDVVFSVSALEHIPGDGDVRAVDEIERVLKPGGLFVFTAPYHETFMETETDHYHFSYEKRYDHNAILNRFASASKLERIELKFINGEHEKSDEISDFWYKYELYRNLGKISMFFSLLMFSISDVPTSETKGFIALYQKTP